MISGQSMILLDPLLALISAYKCLYCVTCTAVMVLVHSTVSGFHFTLFLLEYFIYFIWIFNDVLQLWWKFPRPAPHSTSQPASFHAARIDKVIFFLLQRLSWKDGNIDWLVNWVRCRCTQLSKYLSRCNQCSNQPVNLWLSMPPARPRFPQPRTVISRDGRSALWNVSAFPSTQKGRWTQYYHYGTLGRADYYWQAKWCVSVL